VVNDLTAPSWYNTDTLKRQIFTIIRNDANHHLLREFVKSFRGLSANAKAKIVCDSLPDIHYLCDFESQPERISTLLDLMKETAEPPSPKVLGYIGREHFRLKFDEWYDIKNDRFYYRRSDCIVDGIPYIIEAACAEVETERGELFHLLNFSPTYDDPLSNTLLTAEKVSRYGFRGFMKACYAYSYAEDWEPAKRNVSIALHIVSPAFEFLDRGKTRVSLPAEVAFEVAQVLWAVGKSGLTLQEALDQGLQTETFIRKKALPSRLNRDFRSKEGTILIPKLNELELKYFTGELIPTGDLGKTLHKAQRVELNALGPVERIAFLERKLVEHDATAKVLPPDDILKTYASNTFERKARDEAREEIESRLDIEALIDKAIELAGPAIDPSDEIDEVKEALKTNPPEKWSELLDDLIEDRASETMNGLPWPKLIAELCRKKEEAG
jgi:hypothetical protein